MRSTALLLLLAACGESLDTGAVSGPDSSPVGDPELADLGQAPPPTGAILTRTAALAGHPLRVRSVGHPTTSIVYFGRGNPGLFCPPALGGSCMDINPPILLGTDPADPLRTGEIQIGLPPAMPAGLTTTLQAANTNAGGFPPIVSTTSLVVTENVTACGLNQVSIVRNGDAEVTSGDWYSIVGGVYAYGAPNTAARSLETAGNVDLTQDLQPTPVNTLISANFWTWHDPTGSWPQLIEWGYADGTTGSTFHLSGPGVGGWEQIDLLPLLDPSKSLSMIRVWGYSAGGADIMRADTFAFCTQ